MCNYKATAEQEDNFTSTDEPYAFTDARRGVYFVVPFESEEAEELITRFFPGAKITRKGLPTTEAIPMQRVYVSGVDAAALHWAIEQMIGES